MNHAEQAAFWYLRLNGFFPITNFVIYASSEVTHTSDCDVLALRPPFLYEEVGGKEDDWDPFLRQHLDIARPIGVVCEVKSGRYEKARLFREEVFRYALARLGFVPPERVGQVAAQMNNRALISLGDGTQLAKLLIARHEDSGPFLTRSLTEVEGFLQARVKKYPKQKYADRMFFGPVLFQTVIDLTATEPG